MTEIKVNLVWVKRVMRWTRHLIDIFGMWVIWLTRVYLPILFYANVITVFIVVIITMNILYEEVDLSKDTVIAELEREKNRIINS